jgi:hypothetical protein
MKPTNLALTALALCAAALAGRAADPATASKPSTRKVPITISKETTWATRPVREDGTVDYLAALNARMADGVTKGNNAAILLLKALGPGEDRDGIASELGVKLPEKGDHYVSLAVLDHDPAEKAFLPWKPKDLPEVAEWLANNKAALDLVAEATKRPKFFMPVVVDDESVTLCHAPFTQSLAEYRDLTNALRIRAMRYLGEGQPQAAQEDLLTAHRLARLVGRTGMMRDHLIALAVDTLATAGDMKVLQSQKLTAAQAKGYLAQLDHLGPLPSASEALDSGERLFLLDHWTQFLRAKDFGQLAAQVQAAEKFYGAAWLGPGETHEQLACWRKDMTDPEPRRDVPSSRARLDELADLDAVMRRANQAISDLGKILDQQPAGRRKESVDRFVKTVTNQVKSLGLDPEKPVSEMLVPAVRLPPKQRQKAAELLVLYDFAQSAKIFAYAQRPIEQCRMMLDLVRLGYALAAHRAEKGRYPAKLADLQPGYLKEIPQDRFTGKPLVYKLADEAGKTGYTLYSVGANLKDDGGVEDIGVSNGDIVLTVPAKEDKAPKGPNAE